MVPGRTIAIGDIHGQLRQLDALLEAIALTTKDHLILLGDYVDRGPESAGVLKRILELKKKYDVSAIMGNHEELMLAARSGKVVNMVEWTMNGGDETLRSYGGTRGSLRDVPPEHWHLLEHGLLPYVETDTHIYVHGSCYPDHEMKDQPDYILRWERCDHVMPHMSGKVIVCGHTPQRSGVPLNVGHAICLDTGAAFGRALTAMEAASGKVWQAPLHGRVTKSHISDYEAR